MKMILAALVLLSASGAFANFGDTCKSEKSLHGVDYRVITESDGVSRNAVMVALLRNGVVIGSDRTEKVQVYAEHGRRTLTTDLYSVKFGDGQPQLTILKTGESVALICE